MEKAFKLMSQLSEPVKFSKEQAMEFIQYMSLREGYILIEKHVAAYLMGYSLTSRKLTDKEISAIEEDRLRKHNKAVKFAKKKKLELPEMDTTPISDEVFELTPHPFARDHKDNFLPNLDGFLLFGKIIAGIEKYAVWDVELVGKKATQREADERRLMTVFDPVYKQQGHLVRAWNEIKVDYALASNEVIFNQILADYARLVAYMTEFRKKANAQLKSEPRLFEIYQEIFDGFDPKADWFRFALEDAMTLVAGAKYSPPVQYGTCESIEELFSQYRTVYWNAYKEATKEIKEFMAL